MDAVDIFVGLVNRLRTLKYTPDPIKAGQLLEWIDGDGLESLRAGVEAFLESVMSPPQSVIPITPCLASILHGYVPTQTVDLRYTVPNTAHQLCREGICDRLLTMDFIPYHPKQGQTYPGQLQQLASEAGIGPHVYVTQTCAISPDDTDYDENLPQAVKEYTIRQNLSGPRLSATYPYDSVHIKAALDLIYALMQKTRIMHQENTGKSFMFDGERLYLTDYTNALISTVVDRWNEYDWALYMVRCGEALIESLTGNARSWDDDTPVGRLAVYIKLVNAANEWLTQTFPIANPMVTVDRGTMDFLQGVPGYEKLVVLNQRGRAAMGKIKAKLLTR